MGGIRRKKLNAAAKKKDTTSKTGGGNNKGMGGSGNGDRKRFEDFAKNKNKTGEDNDGKNDNKTKKQREKEKKEEKINWKERKLEKRKEAELKRMANRNKPDEFEVVSEYGETVNNFVITKSDKNEMDNIDMKRKKQPKTTNNTHDTDSEEDDDDNDDDDNDEYVNNDDNDDDDDDDDENFDKLKKKIQSQPNEYQDALSSSSKKKKKRENEKNKPTKGSFQALGISHNIFKGICRMGYKLPTPVQRKSLPYALAERDVVCMARTGSGKTAAFLIPVLEKLQEHQNKIGARGIILSPTRELAIQTAKFARSMGKFTDLRVAIILGGDSMDEQFQALSKNPDIIIATPGRLTHHLQEIPDFSLNKIEIVVFDECDRLFEMGFAEQIREIMKEIPEERQTLLFSATLPKALAQFARAGLRDPELIRLDTDCKVSENLKLAFLTCRTSDKPATLLYILRETVPQDQMTIIFVATRHHVEFIYELMKEAGYDSAPIYGQMDQEARKLNLEKFRRGKVKYLIVTDVAARGIDVPLLDNVINYNFPPSPKLFIHRVGRAARQGRSGTAVNITDSDELPYMADLHLFLGRSLENRYLNEMAKKIIETEDSDGTEKKKLEEEQEAQGYKYHQMTPSMVHYGCIPQHIIDSESEYNNMLMNRNSSNLMNMARVCGNAMKQYRKTRPDPSKRGVQRSKECLNCDPHPFFIDRSITEDKLNQLKESTNFLKQLQQFRPKETIFEARELNSGGSLYKGIETKSVEKSGLVVMKSLRKDHKDTLKRRYTEMASAKNAQYNTTDNNKKNAEGEQKPVTVTATRLSKVRKVIVEEKAKPTEKRKLSKADRKKMKQNGGKLIEKINDDDNIEKKETKTTFMDQEHYIGYGTSSRDQLVETALQPRSNEKLTDSFMGNMMEDAILDVTPDESLDMMKKRKLMKWDARKKKFIQRTVAEMAENKPNVKIRNEAGAVVNQKTSRPGEAYEKWKKKTKKSIAANGGEEEEETGGRGLQTFGMRTFRHNMDNTAFKVDNTRAKEELKSVSEIRKNKAKEFKEKERLKAKASGAKKQQKNQKMLAKGEQRGRSKVLMRR